MANITTSPNMQLPVPVVGVDPGPQYAVDLNSCLTLVDQHNHAAGYGVQINPSGININSDLGFNGNNATLLRSARLSSQTSVLSGAADLGCISNINGNLYWNNSGGTQIQITNSSGIVGTSGSIANLTSPATASYVSANSTFVWQSAANTPANLDAASVIFRNLAANSKALTLSPPASMGANYTITLPSLPAQTNVMTLDSSGNMGSITYDAVGSNMTSTGANAIAASRTRATGASTVGIGGVAVSSSSGFFSDASGSFVSVTNLSVTITTSGRPIFVGLISDGSGNLSVLEAQIVGSTNNVVSCQFGIYNGSTQIAQSFWAVAVTASNSQLQSVIPVSSASTLDFQSAGTYTYTFKINSTATNFRAYCQYAKLIAYEL